MVLNNNRLLNIQRVRIWLIDRIMKEIYDKIMNIHMYIQVSTDEKGKLKYQLKVSVEGCKN